MTTIYYLPLEPYKERYTEQLYGWTLDRFLARGFQVRGVEVSQAESPDWFLFPVCGDESSDSGERVIETGGPLDCFGRSHWALTQTARLVALLQRHGVHEDDVFYFQDMFHPGIEALPYIAEQCGGVKPKIYVVNWAQSVDCYDFTFPMRGWMRPFEEMVGNIAWGIFVASEELKQLCHAAMYPTAVHNCGLPFDSNEVRRRAGEYAQIPWEQKEKRVVFTSRLDAEKQPNFFASLAVAAKSDPELKHYEFAICTGNPRLRGNNSEVLAWINDLVEKGLIRAYTDLSKEEYYRILATSRLHFHCSKQDWVSYTMLEAAALATPTLCPAFRSFPEAVNYDPERMYIPWSEEDALAKIRRILFQTGSALSARCAEITARHDRALDVHIDLMLEKYVMTW